MHGQSVKNLPLDQQCRAYFQVTTDAKRVHALITRCLLRPQADSTAQDRLRDLILEAYEAYTAEAVAS